MTKTKLKACLILLFSTLQLCAFSQSISGVINDYYKVIEVVPSKACVRLNSTAGLSQYDFVMLVQMKGATINLTNTASFGSVTTYNDAGKYEMASVCGINGDSVFFLHDILNTYDPAGKVQLVRVPQYASATVTGVLKPAPWNNTTGSGGVLALIVTNTLTLNANIAADSMGFDGGAVLLQTNSCGAAYTFNAYATNPTSNLGGAYKGEGIVDVTAANSGARGAAANGGGGGNDHNNGGGGGGNIGAGGSGGNNNSTTGCTKKYPGIGAYGLTNTGNRVFMGGGGGFGHGNNTNTAYGGGEGGGIILIRAGSIVGNGNAITANGAGGPTTIGDGAAGGGGGGTIILDAGSYNNLSVAAEGGKGGDVDNILLSNRSMGPAGGGGGGAIYFTGALPAITTSVAGGIAGTSFNTNPAGLTGNNGATGGSTGTVEASYSISQSATPASYCSGILLPKVLLFFDGYKRNDRNTLNWEVTASDHIKFFIVESSHDGLHWQKEEEIFPSGKKSFSTSYKSTAIAVVYYRLKIAGTDNSVNYSKVVTIKNELTTSVVSIYPNPATDVIQVHSSLQGTLPVHIFSEDGKLVYCKPHLFRSNTITLPVSNLQKGIYIVVIDGIKSKLVIR